MMVDNKRKRKKIGKEMDLRLASSSSGKRKLSEDQGTDIISNLPDCVLHHILSFLSTKDVIATSILSRKWRYMWTSVAIIDLDDGTSWEIENRAHRKMSKNNFLKLVNRVLSSHDASVIKRLRLCMVHLPEKFSRLNLWISLALEHNVEELELLLGGGAQCELPCSLFTSSYLTSLKIDSRLTLKAPPETCLLKLKKLHLSQVKFADELSTQWLFSNCPVLDELKLANCNWENIKNVIISIPTLRNLTIYGDVNSGYFHGIRVGKYITESHVQITAANLAYLDLSSHLDVDFEFTDLSSLKTASLDLPYNDGIEEEVASRVLRLFSWISNVEYLTLSAVTIECLRVKNDFLDHLPTFDSVKHLMVYDRLYGDYAVFLLEFLEKIPKLEYLELSEGCEEPIWDDDELITLRGEIMRQTAPSCFNSTLETFAVKEFRGVLLERLMVEYVLKSATVLKSLCISCSENLNKKRLSYFRGRLKKIPRGSESCSIEFST